jgi:hypothetical protein
VPSTLPMARTLLHLQRRAIETVDLERRVPKVEKLLAKMAGSAKSVRRRVQGLASRMAADSQRSNQGWTPR